jgi:hypothetical protein
MVDGDTGPPTRRAGDFHLRDNLADTCPAATPTRRHLLPDTVGLRQAISPVWRLALTTIPADRKGNRVSSDGDKLSRLCPERDTGQRFRGDPEWCRISSGNSHSDTGTVGTPRSRATAAK